MIGHRDNMVLLSLLLSASSHVLYIGIASFYRYWSRTQTQMYVTMIIVTHIWIWVRDHFGMQYALGVAMCITLLLQLRADYEVLEN